MVHSVHHLPRVLLLFRHEQKGTHFTYYAMYHDEPRRIDPAFVKEANKFISHFVALVLRCMDAIFETAHYFPENPCLIPRIHIFYDVPASV